MTTITLHVDTHQYIAAELIDIEDLTEDELMVIKKYYIKLGELACKEKDIHKTHSLDEAEDNHEAKLQVRKK